MANMYSLMGAFVFFTLILAAALWPLWRSADKSRKLILGLSCLITPILAILLYAYLGAYTDIEIRDEYQRMNRLAEQGQNISEEEHLALMSRIEARALKDDNAEYWYLLAGNYEGLGRYTEAAAAYEKAADTYADDVSILSRWTETEFISQGYNLTPKVQGLAQRVLALDPSNASVLGMLGIAAFQQGQIEPAIQFWERALTSLEPMSANAMLIQQSIAQARELLAQAQGLASDPSIGQDLANQSDSASLSLPGIPLHISLAPGIELDDSVTLFIFARVPGSRVPTAVNRLTLGSLPAQLTLDDSMVMIPGTQLMAMPELELVARASRSGQPAAQPGDYEVIVGGIVPAEIEGVVEMVIRDQIN